MARRDLERQGGSSSGCQAALNAQLGDDAGTQFRHFVDDIFQLLCWYPGPDYSPSLTDPRNKHLAFRTTVLATIGALVANATSEI